MLEKSDFMQFGGKLRNFAFHGKILEVIEGDLFDGNPNIEELYLGNGIKDVGRGAFKNSQDFTLSLIIVTRVT